MGRVPVESGYPCLCCGQRTLPAEPPGTWLVCSVCEWTDIAQDSRYAANQLDEARWSYARKSAGASELADARSPRDESRDRVTTAIRAAFADVRPNGRVSLRQAYQADYDLPPSADDVGGQWEDQDERWSDIPHGVIEYFAVRTSVFIFGNAQSFHYYLPAYMLWDLDTRDVNAAEAVAKAPDEHLALLDEPQRAAVRAYLQHILDFDGPHDGVERARSRLG